MSKKKSVPSGPLVRPLGRNEVLPGVQCAADGLGPDGSAACKMPRMHDNVYCYYHDKLATGVIDTVQNGRGTEVSGSSVYPVWPLPRRGYVLVSAA